MYVGRAKVRYGDDAVWTGDYYINNCRTLQWPGSGPMPRTERVAETGVTTGLSLIPEVGEVLSVFVEAFWPADKEDGWGEIKDEVEQVVDKKISEEVWKRNSQGLKGLRANFDNYLVHLKDSKDVNEISQDWHAANSQFQQWVPQFQEPGFEVLLLPLFAQVANLHLALLRDGVLFGAKWGMQPDTVQSYAKQQTSLIGSYSRYAERIYLNGYLDALDRGGLDYNSCQPFATTNAYRRGMTLRWTSPGAGSTSTRRSIRMERRPSSSGSRGRSTATRSAPPSTAA